MSKRLAKIISICAMAVVLPFAVIAVALTFTQFKDNNANACDYPAMSFSYEARANEAGKEYGQVLYSGETMIQDSTFMTINPCEISLEDSFYNYFLGGYENITTISGETCVFNGEIRVALEGTIISVILNATDSEFNILSAEEITFGWVYGMIEESFLLENIDIRAMAEEQLLFDIDFRFDIV